MTLVFALGFLLIPGGAESHELDSATLSLREVEAGRFSMRWHASSATLQGELESPARFPEPCHLDGDYLTCGATGLVGSIEFPWLEGTLTHVMVEIEWRSGARLWRVVNATSPSLRVYGDAGSRGLRAIEPVVFDYTWLGIEHILTGFDHLLFVVALALLVKKGTRLLATITAFTAAHSLSLAATVLGLVSLPSPPVEAAIALSIVLVCAECLRPAESLTRRAPWLVAFAFGLLHGLGFASALLAVGLPERRVPIALFCFNAGVELGQLGVLAVVGGLGMLATRLRWERAGLVRGLVYAMGSIAAFWSIDRVGAVLGF
jgi:hydrogenase/urease accessory protein HupE